MKITKTSKTIETVISAISFLTLVTLLYILSLPCEFHNPVQISNNRKPLFRKLGETEKHKNDLILAVRDLIISNPKDIDKIIDDIKKYLIDIKSVRKYRLDTKDPLMSNMIIRDKILSLVVKLKKVKEEVKQKGGINVIIGGKNISFDHLLDFGKRKLRRSRIRHF